MLLSMSVMLTYGAWLAHGILSRFIHSLSIDDTSQQVLGRDWSKGITWSQYLSLWSWALGHDVRIGSVGLLALLTSPLAWALLLYHMYLIWAGTTTNESAKWQELRYDINDGLVYQEAKPEDPAQRNENDSAIEPIVQWPAFSHQNIVRFRDPRQLHEQDESQIDRANEGSRWKRIEGLHEIENLYDLGFWDNLKDILPNA